MKRSFALPKAFVWIVPLGVFLIVFQLWPAIDVVRLSFTNARFAVDTAEFSTRAYQNIFRDPEMPMMLRTTFIFVGFSVIAQVGLGLVIAIAVDQGNRMRIPGSIMTRTSVMLGWAIPGVVVGLIWLLLLNESQAGIMTYLLSLIGVNGVPFLSSPRVALAMAILANTWRGTASAMILMYAALQTVPDEIVEAGIIDGASKWQLLRYIVVAYIRPIIFITLILSTIGTFNTFDMIVALTGGGPGRATEVIALHVYVKIFRQLNFGGGAAVAVMLLSLNGIMSLIYFFLLKRDPRSNL